VSFFLQALRQAALSMAWANQKLLGCGYPEAVESTLATAPVKGRQQRATGYSVQGELAAAAVTNGKV
jgi:hypothetical protein